MKLPKRVVSILVSSCIALGIAGHALADQETPAPGLSPTAPPIAIQHTPDELQQLVAPIALYPDTLVAQILAASTHLAEVVDADRWIQAHPGLKGEALAAQVDQQYWDASVKALTEIPSVLSNMDQNVVWTSSLGDAYLSQPQQVMAAVQAMRQRAQAAGNLQSTGQQTVSADDGSISIAPVDPDVVYVPEYDPWVVYGAPVAVWPGWYPYSNLYLAGPGIVFGIGFELGYFGGYGWGWHHWRPDWHRRTVTFNHNPYVWHDRGSIDANHMFHGHDGFNHPEGAFGQRGSFGERGLSGMADPHPHAMSSHVGPEPHAMLVPGLVGHFRGVGQQGFAHAEFGGGHPGFGEVSHFAGGHFGGGHFSGGGGGGHGGGGRG